MMKYIFLSPHFDDVVFSCGGLIWELVRNGAQVQIWTICAASPNENDMLSEFAQTLHRRWGFRLGLEANQRQKEDEQAAHVLGVERREFTLKDCIYRHSAEGLFYYSSEGSLFGEIHPAEAELMNQLAEEFRKLVPARARMVSPLGVGHHVDHQLTRKAAEREGRKVWYYADVPYVFREPSWRERYLPGLVVAQRIPISGEGLHYWVKAAAAYTSQVSSFWQDEIEMRSAFQQLIKEERGGSLWKVR
ncbi:MAG: PIG-L deacetylase family protein [Chloroflexota bacterium]